ncbi:Thioesterase/thiol ester dehydrase-isomerase [Ophiobolus disseminans]|uniref:Thioesterase/thiol ester dehydrase-isomerase n=1 Tax=Ophiobolus disseminans TaxID=1469910 RepID=A0A6A7AKN2_9PLEO|nr:Thioesterase/thiol ester dehydrase-isomerase [Ophiobolus disseminans]
MSSARLALSRHVGQTVSRTHIAPLRREVGRWSIKDGRGLKARWKGLDRQSSIRWQSSVASQSQTTIPNESQTPPPPPPPPKTSLLIRAPIALALTLLTFALGFTMAGAPALSSLADIANPPTDAETLDLFVPSTDEVAAIEKALLSHPLVRELLQEEGFIASRPHLKIPEKLRAQNLTGGTLQGPDKLAVPPLQFTTEDGSQFVSFQYVGHALCGHPGIVHGGLLATLLDEGLARCCFPALPNKVAVTASLKIEYKAPAMAGQVLVLRAETTKVEGRKAWVVGRLETLVSEEEHKAGKREGVVLTTGEALFIEPRQAASMRRVVN